MPMPSVTVHKNTGIIATASQRIYFRTFRMQRNASTTHGLEPGTFLGTITRRLACSRLRTDYAQKRGSGQIPLILDELDACLPTAPNVTQIVEAKQLEKAINTFLHTLPEQGYNIFLRLYWHAESIDQIARRYDILPNTIKSTLYRSRRKLRAYLEKEELL